MDIGIIGAGNIGGTAARLFAQARHRVTLGTARGPASLAGIVAEIGSGATAATVEEAAGFGEVVLVAIPFGRYATLPAARLVGRVVVDAMNYSREGTFKLTGL